MSTLYHRCAEMQAIFFIFFIFFSLDKRPRPLPIFEKIQTLVLLLVGGGVKIPSSDFFFLILFFYKYFI